MYLTYYMRRSVMCRCICIFIKTTFMSCLSITFFSSEICKHKKNFFWIAFCISVLHHSLHEPLSGYTYYSIHYWPTISKSILRHSCNLSIANLYNEYFDNAVLFQWVELNNQCLVRNHKHSYFSGCVFY